MFEHAEQASSSGVFEGGGVCLRVGGVCLRVGGGGVFEGGGGGGGKQAC